MERYERMMYEARFLWLVVYLIFLTISFYEIPTIGEEFEDKHFYYGMYLILFVLAFIYPISMNDERKTSWETPVFSGFLFSVFFTFIAFYLAYAVDYRGNYVFQDAPFHRFILYSFWSLPIPITLWLLVLAFSKIRRKIISNKVESTAAEMSDPERPTGNIIKRPWSEITSVEIINEGENITDITPPLMKIVFSDGNYEAVHIELMPYSYFLLLILQHEYSNGEPKNFLRNIEEPESWDIINLVWHHAYRESFLDHVQDLLEESKCESISDILKSEEAMKEMVKNKEGAWIIDPKGDRRKNYRQDIKDAIQQVSFLDESGSIEFPNCLFKPFPSLTNKYRFKIKGLSRLSKTYFKNINFKYPLLK